MSSSSSESGASASSSSSSASSTPETAQGPKTYPSQQVRVSKAAKALKKAAATEATKASKKAVAKPSAKSSEPAPQVGQKRKMGPTIQEPQPPKKKGAATEGAPKRSARKRAPKKRQASTSDLVYGGPFGGGGDFFGWAPAVAERENMPCTEGPGSRQPMRTKRMEDMEGCSTPYIVKPAEIVVRQEDVPSGFLGAGGCCLTDPQEKFYAHFLAPIRVPLNPHNYVVETARQIFWSSDGDKYRFEVKGHANAFRGCLGDVPGFQQWGRHVAAHHAAVLEEVGIRGAILATGEGFWKMPDVVNAFVSFWSP